MIRQLLIILTALSCQTPKKEEHYSKHDKKRLVVCSQNLARYGENKKDDKQLYYLVERMKRAECSVVALQEISLKKPKAIEELASELSKKTNRSYQAYVGKSRDHYIANGFLVAEDLGQVKGIDSYWNRSLPRINPYGPARNFARGPVKLKVELSPNYRFANKKYLDLYSIHFKSKRDGWKDPAKLNFEIDRIESAQAVRDLALRELNTETLLLIMGDRNNGKDKASDEVLEGRVELKDLAQGGICELTKNEIALCSKSRKPALIGLFGLRLERFPGRYAKGSHQYRGKESLLDEAFIRPKDLEFVTKSDNTLSIGYQGEYYRGSDHKLLYVVLGN